MKQIYNLIKLELYVDAMNKFNSPVIISVYNEKKNIWNHIRYEKFISK